MYKICLVEDETDLATVVKMYLEKAGYYVTTFSTGTDAINYIGNDVDIWILDIMLGDDVNGYDVIKAIRGKISFGASNNLPQHAIRIWIEF